MPENLPENNSSCPLCRSPKVHLCGTTDRGLSYFSCGACELIWKHPRDFPSFEQERDRYLQHQNDPHQPAYQKWILELWQPLWQHWQRLGYSGQARILDYGCGPEKVLAQALQVKIKNVKSYDPVFYPDQNVLNEKWDLIYCNEVWEHFQDPQREIGKLRMMMNPGGGLGVRTSWHQGPQHFATWWYQHDITHLHFFNQRALEKVAELFDWQMSVAGKDLVIFLNPNSD